MTKIIYADESYAIQGACFEVYKQMGCGFLEAVYQECLHKEFVIQNIPFDSQPTLRLYYKEMELTKTYTPDFVCFDKIIVELKAVSNISGEHRAQILNYLKASGFKLGLLVNFGSHPKAVVERFAL